MGFDGPIQPPSGHAYANDGPPSVRFVETAKQLAKSYYPFIYVDKRRLSKSVVDLQACIEVCSDSLDEIDRVAADIESLNYAMYGLEQALGRAVSELIIIRDEIHELLISLKESERFNLRLYDQLMNVDRCTSDGIEASQQTLNASKSRRTSQMGLMDKYRIPKSTNNALEQALCGASEPQTRGDVTMTGLLTGQPLDTDYHHWASRIQRELSHRHAEFSFLTIGLWTEGVYENHDLIVHSRGCFGCRRPSSSSARGEGDHKSLFLAHHGKIDDAPATLGVIQTKVHDLGAQIFEELGRQKRNYQDSKRLHKDMTSELSERRRQLVESLLATHHAVQTLLEMDEQNDGLVGKLIKTRPLFAELHQALICGNLEGNFTDGSRTDGTGGSGAFQLLPEVLGPEGWTQLLEMLKTVKLNGAGGGTSSSGFSGKKACQAKDKNFSNDVTANNDVTLRSSAMHRNAL